MRRYLLEELLGHYRDHRQMIFLSGPRQVGKTTVARMLGEAFPVNGYRTPIIVPAKTFLSQLV